MQGIYHALKKKIDHRKNRFQIEAIKRAAYRSRELAIPVRFVEEGTNEIDQRLFVLV